MMKPITVLLFLLLFLLPWTVWGLEAKGICVTDAEANLRAGAGKNFRISWEVKRYMPLVQVAQQGEWLKVSDVDGDIHWILASLISGKIKCITVKKVKARVRRGPSKKSKTWTTVEKYTSFRLLEQKNEWMKVEVLIKAKRKVVRRTGWIFRDSIWPS